jgi:hypothetical protein
MRKKGGLLVGSVALLGLLVLASPAAAAKDQQASFKIEIRADQHSSWTLDFTTPSCGSGTSHLTGHGEHGFAMATNKPFKVKVFREPSGGGSAFSFFEYGRGAQGVPVSVAAVREGVTSVETTGGEPCGDGGDGSGTPPASDCGPRSFNAELILDYYSPLDFPDSELTPLVDVLSPSGPFDAAGFSGDALWDELYTNCPAVGSNGGQLLLSPAGGISPKKLFGKKKSFKVKASDTAVDDTDTSHEETRMSWTIEFTRR